MNLDCVEMAVARMAGRIVAQHVVVTVRQRYAGKCRVQIIGVDCGESASFVGQRAQSLMRRTELRKELRGTYCQIERRLGTRHAFNRVGGHAGQAARIDRVDVHVRPGGGAENITHRAKPAGRTRQETWAIGP